MPAPQNPYFIRGTVTKNGIAQGSATVTVRNDTKGEEDTCVTDAQGRYVFMLSWLTTDYEDADAIEVSALLRTESTTIDLTNYPPGREVNIVLYSGALYYYKTLLTGGGV